MTAKNSHIAVEETEEAAVFRGQGTTVPVTSILGLKHTHKDCDQCFLCVLRAGTEHEPITNPIFAHLWAGEANQNADNHTLFG